jgi:hypothetical protein
MNKLRKAGIVAALAAMVLALAACESVTIGRLLSDPSHWEGKAVHIRGTVDDSIGVLGHGAYKVSDGTGSIWVISRTGLPGRGARIDVEGSIFQGAQLAGQSLGTALRETRHRTH